MGGERTGVLETAGFRLADGAAPGVFPFGHRAFIFVREPALIMGVDPIFLLACDLAESGGRLTVEA